MKKIFITSDLFHFITLTVVQFSKLQTNSVKRETKKKKKEKEHEKAESNERDKAKDIRIIKRLTIHGGYISNR